MVLLPSSQVHTAHAGASTRGEPRHAPRRASLAGRKAFAGPSLSRWAWSTSHRRRCCLPHAGRTPQETSERRPPAVPPRALALPGPVPPPKAGSPPLTPQMHTRLRATLADKRYLACPKADLPAARVHQTAQHESGMVHAADNYYGGEWYDGIEVRAIFFTSKQRRAVTKKLFVFLK